jgi:signal transduction histidine kinase
MGLETYTREWVVQATLSGYRRKRAAGSFLCFCRPEGEVLQPPAWSGTLRPVTAMSAESRGTEAESTGAEDSVRGLRLALMAGFGGILLIFAVAAVDAVRLLHEMHAENNILRAASLDRSHRLASIRSYVLLSDTYIGDYLLDSDGQTSSEHLAQMRAAWSRTLNDLGAYHSSTLDEAVMLKQLQKLLERHWQHVSHAMDWPKAERRGQGAAFYGDEILPLRTTVVEISTRVEQVDAKQLANTEGEIQSEFERLGGRLSVVLIIALVAACLLGVGCVVYALRIERQNRRRYQEIVEARRTLQRLSARLVDAQETERRTISRELHDQVGQTLNALLVDAANLAKRIPEEDSISRRYLDNMRTFADSSVNALRDIALLLRPSMLDDLGLIPALEWQAREVSRRSGIKVKVEAEKVPDSLPDAVRTCVYRVVQETLQNVSRHSGARSAAVTVRQADGSLELAVEDDGHGFDPVRTRGLGLLGMEERVKQLGGRLEIQSQPDKGTRLHVTLPIAVPVTG